MGSLIFMGAILDSSLQQLRDKVDVNVYFTVDAPEDDILSIKTALEEFPEVAYVEYISREQALEDFQKRHENDQLILQALEELEDNPLGAHLNVKAKETSQYESIANFLEGEDAVGGGVNASIIEKVNFFQNKVAIEKLTEIVDSIDKLSLFTMLIFAILSILIVFNTIRLAIYTSREEISVMRLVGASHGYIRGPFLVEGIMYGVISALAAIIIFYPVTLWLGPLTENFFGGTSIFDYYVDNFAQLFIMLLLAGIFLGALSSYLAVKKYLKI